MANPCILKFDHICKSFSSTKALADISFEVNRGEVRGLIGENGSGKSTLSSIVSGTLQPDSGTMYFQGDLYRPSSVLEAANSGISMVVQERGTIPGITVAANIFLGKEKLFLSGGLVSHKKMNDAAAKILADIGAQWIRPDTLIDDISFEESKIVELARAMYGKPEILIIDETTTAISQRGREILYALVKRMKSESKTVLFITHDLDELIQVCDTVTVMRDGRFIASLAKAEMKSDTLKRLMVGREITGSFYRADYDENAKFDDVALKLDHVTLDGKIRDISLEAHRGEILGIGGLTDCGMHEIGRAMFGLTKPLSGDVTVLPSGKAIANPRAAIRNRVGYLSKNRDQEAILLQTSILDNICLPSLDRLERAGFISRGSERSLAGKWAGELNVKMSSLSEYCSSLSGGNKQKVVIAKWLANDSEIFVLDCPTRGIDIGVKSAIYRLMEQLKAEGKCLIMISEELPELIGMCDNILILKDGRISARLARGRDLTESGVIQYMI
jgi:ribose transport system ATP-binding protein